MGERARFVARTYMRNQLKEMEKKGGEKAGSASSSVSDLTVDIDEPEAVVQNGATHLRKSPPGKRRIRARSG